MKKLVQFIKYNNGFVIILGLVFAVSGGVFANEASREAIIGKTIITRQGVDNSQIIGANLGNFNMDFKIERVTEDDRGYNIGYFYNTIYIKDNVWQPLIKNGEMYVSKAGLGDKDLGLDVAEELGQKADYEIAYLKEVQLIEKSKGTLKQTESVEYTGLKGLVFDSGKREIEGYEPVKEEENQKAEVIGVFNPSVGAEEKKKKEEEEEEKVVQQITVVKEMVSKEVIMEMVREALAQEQGGGNSALSSSSSSSSSATTSVSSSESSSSLSSSSASSASSSEAVSSGSSESSSSGETISSSSSSESSSSSVASESSSSSAESSVSSMSAESSSSSEAASSSSEAASSSSETAISSSANSSISSSESSSSLPVSEASSSSVAI